MKKIVSVLTIISINFLFTSLSVLGNKVETTSKIEKVTVFNKGVNVQRFGNLDIKKGDNTIYIQELSPYLSNESIQFVIKSPKVIINSVGKEMNYLGIQNHLTDEVKLLKDSLDLTHEKLRLAQVSLRVYNEEKDLLDENKSVLKLSKEFIIDDLMDLTDFFRERMLDIEEKISFTNKRITKINQTIANIQSQLRTLNARVRNQFSNVVVQITSKEELKVAYELSYNINDRAGWKPCFDLRIEKMNSPVDITYKAEIYQNTNEQWKNINVSLSTGNLNQSNKAPAFNTDYLSVRRNLRNKYRVQTSSNPRYDNYSSEEAGASVDMEMAMDDDVGYAETSAAFTTVDFSGTQIQYDIALPYSISSSSKSIFIEIQKINLPATYDYYTYPKLDKDVFLMCHFTSIAEQNFLAGSAQIYFEGKSVGTTYLDPLSTKSTIDLSLSRDLSILTTRKPLKKFSSETKISDKVKQERSFEITLKNNKSSKITVKLVDQIPVSNDKSIDVELVESTEAKFNKNKGKLTWLIDLEPNTSTTKKFTYTVKYPEDERVIGL